MLTSLIKEKEVQERLERSFKFINELKGFSIPEKVEALPLTTNYTQVGTASDYLIRLLMIQGNRENTCFYPIVAEQSRELIQNYGDEELTKSYEEIIGKYHSFLGDMEKGSVWGMKELSELSLRLTHIDAIYRYWASRSFSIREREEIRKQLGNTASDEEIDGMLAWKIKTEVIPHIKEQLKGINGMDTIDIMHVGELFMKSKLSRVKKYAMLNPSFMDSMRFGGADADLVVDDYLIDIKTTKINEWKKSYWYQLIGYYFLSEDYGIDTGQCVAGKYFSHSCYRDYEVKRLGIYFSRHGVLRTFYSGWIESIPDYDDVKEWFFSCAQKYFNIGNGLPKKN